jgi:hypothetical protein
VQCVDDQQEEGDVRKEPEEDTVNEALKKLANASIWLSVVLGILNVIRKKTEIQTISFILRGDCHHL